MSFESDRRFSREEIQEIFRRAAERQAKKRDTDDGLTLNELQQIGEETGISPDYIAAVVRELERPEPEEAAPPSTNDAPRGIERFYGVKSSARFERVVPGRLDDPAWDDIVAALDSTFQNKGKVTTAGPLREWHLASSLGFDMRAFGPGTTASDWLKVFDSMSSPTKGPVTVEVCPEGDETRVEMVYAMPNGRLWEGPGFVGLFLSIAAVVMTVFGFVGEPMILIAPLIMLLLSVGIGGSILVSHRNEIHETKERMQKAMKRIEQMQIARPTSKPSAHSTRSDQIERDQTEREEAQSERLKQRNKPRSRSESVENESAQEKHTDSKPWPGVEDTSAEEESTPGRSSQRSRS